jgi:hypothetical protein
MNSHRLAQALYPISLAIMGVSIAIQILTLFL